MVLVIELCIPNNRMFFLGFDWTVFGGKMTSHDWQQIKISTNDVKNRIIFKEHGAIKSIVKFFFLKAQLDKKFLSFHYLIFGPFVTIFRNISKFQNALQKQLNLSKKIFTFVSTPSSSLKIIYFFFSSWTLNFGVNHVTSFSRQKNPLKSKNKKKHTIVWNTKFFHPVKYELKRMKTVKLFLGCSFRGKADQRDNR